MHIHNKIITLSFLTKTLLYFCFYTTTYIYSMDKGYSNLFTGPCTIERIHNIAHCETDEYSMYIGRLPCSILKAKYYKLSSHIEVIRQPMYFGITMNSFTYEDTSWYEILKEHHK